MSVADFFKDLHIGKHLAQTMNPDSCNSNSNPIDPCMEWKKFLWNVGNCRKKRVVTKADHIKKTVKQCVL